MAGGHSRARGQHSNENQVKEAIIDLYLKVKIRSKDEVSHLLFAKSILLYHRVGVIEED